MTADALMQIDPSTLESLKFTTPISPNEKRRLAAQKTQKTASNSRVHRGGHTGSRQRPKESHVASWGNATGSKSQSRPAEYVGASRSSGMNQRAPNVRPSESSTTKAPESFDEDDISFNYEDGTTLTQLDEDALYQSFRSQALKARRQRDRLREQAHTLYLQGDDKARNEKLQRARELSDQIRSLNENAARHIFEYKNREEFGMGEFKMDLHGLHATEAVRFLDERLYDLSLKMIDIYDVKERKELLVVVGKGNHQRGVIMLQPAIQEFLHQAGVKATWKPEEGTFHVTIPRYYDSSSPSSK